LILCTFLLISAIWKYGFYYERAVTARFEEILLSSQKSTSSETRVLDVGGNIGYYTLVSASVGPVTVDAFEPNVKNILRFCESLDMNRWYSEYDDNANTVAYSHGQNNVSKVNLYPFGVGETDGFLDFTLNENNPGQGSFANAGHGPNAQDIKTVKTRVVTLDKFAAGRGWFESRPDIAILKVDVEGFEYGVIRGAKELLKAKIIRNILMEVSARDKEERKANEDALHILLSSGYQVEKYGGYIGPNKVPPIDWPRDDPSGLVNAIMNQTVRETSKQLNLWWTIR
jgi:FkbM family methyltransferase